MFNKDVKIQIFSIRTERNSEQSMVPGLKCEHHELGSFKIEELNEQFLKRDINLVGKVDLIFTRWAFRHFADLLATLLQAYSLLRPMSGLMFFDGFHVHLPGSEDFCNNADLFGLLHLIDYKIVMQKYTSKCSFNRFVMARSTDEIPNIPLQYYGFSFLPKKRQVQSRVITHFKPTESITLVDPFKHKNKNMSNGAKLYGDSSLFLHLNDHQAWRER